MLRLLWLIAVIFLVIWLLSLVFGFISGPSLHTLLVIAIILFIIWLVRGRS
jgi:hypothetical protein